MRGMKLKIFFLYNAGGPVGPDVCFTDPEPVMHTVLIHADPAGQDASAVGTPSPSDCFPAGPAGPYVAGGPVGPDDYLQALESCEQLVLDCMPLIWILRNH